MSSPHQPPRTATAVLERLLPERLRDSVLGDLEEEWRLRTAQRPRSASLWYCRQACALALRLGQYSLANERPRPQPRKGDPGMETLWNDARFGARVLARSPGFTLVAILTLALGIGANTAIFSVVSALLIKPLPLPDSERLVSVGGRDAKGAAQYVSFPDFEDLRSQARQFEGFAAVVHQSVNLTGRSEPQRVRGGFVSDNFFDLVGVQPTLGRGFQSGDDALSAAAVCVLQHETWQGVFGGDPAIVGQSIVLNNTPFTVVGVLPSGFRFPFDEAEVWLPHHTWPPFKTADNHLNRANGLVGPIGKLRPGVSLAAGQAELTTIAARLAQQYPDAGAGRSLQAQPLRDRVVANVRQMVLVLMGAVAFVLLIACANVANLMLARATARQSEIATRAALGASRARLVRQLLTETALLWAAGGVLGIGLGQLGLKALLASAPGALPGGIVPALDWTVLGFAAGVCGVTGVGFGAYAALLFSRPNLSAALKEGGRAGDGPGRTRFGSALVVAQVALTLVMLIGSGLLLRSFDRLTQVNVGFATENLLTLEYRLPANKYPDGAAQWETHRKIVERVRAVPGVKSAAVARAVPFGGNGSSVPFEVPGHAPADKQDAPRVQMNFADAYYFETLGIPLLRGRTLTEQDAAGAPAVVVVNRRLAERYWPDQDPVGRTLRFPDSKPPLTATIVGVVGDVKHYGLDDPEQMQAYASQAQQPHIFNSLVVRTAGDPLALTQAVRAAVWSVDPEQPMWKIFTMEQLVDRSLGQPRFLMRLMTAYSALALLLAAVGLYGVMAYAVGRRARELGIRMALGAQARDVLRLVLGDGARLTGAGLVLGLVAAIGLGGSVRGLLFGVPASDPATLVGAALVLASVALLACYVPARRATRTDPLAVLHRG